MYERKREADQLMIAAAQKSKEKEYWLDTLAGDLAKSSFYPDSKTKTGEKTSAEYRFSLDNESVAALNRLSNGSPQAIHVMLTTALAITLEKYTGNQDILLGTPIYKQQTTGDLTNTVLPLKISVSPGLSFKKLLGKAKSTVIDAIRHQSYPLEVLVKDLGFDSGEFPLFDVALVLENIQDISYLESLPLNIIFQFQSSASRLDCLVHYNGNMYLEASIRRISSHYLQLMTQALANPNVPVSGLDILSREERNRLLRDQNSGPVSHESINKTIPQLFGQHAAKYPDQSPLDSADGRDSTLTYKELGQHSRSLAMRLKEHGLEHGDIAGILMERSSRSLEAVLGVFNTGGACLMIDPDTPVNRLDHMLEQCQSSVLLSDIQSVKKHSFSHLQNLRAVKTEPIITPKRAQIKAIDELPMVDRSYVDYRKYDPYIGDPLVKNTYITLQATRGCPYKCVYCHRIWPKSHINRSAENIFKEVKHYYDMGVRRFSFVDDIFNLKYDNSSSFFRMLLENDMKVQIFFPNGMRGDILTREYIDLMAEAGVVNLPLALETASPRLQKLLRKNIQLKKFRENIEYICATYPHIILELFTMHGLVTETKEEAMMTFNFIKSLKWLHFPYINIMRVYPNTDMEQIALDHGVSAEAIDRSEGLAYHELPDTLPFDRGFTLQYQSNLLHEYFLNKERLLHVLPRQLKILTRDEMVQKYDSYLPVSIRSFDQLLEFLGINEEELGIDEYLAEDHTLVPDLNERIKEKSGEKAIDPDAKKILFLDVSQYFMADKGSMLYDVVEPPLGLMCLATYMDHEFGSRVQCKIAKSRIEFDNYRELKELLETYKPDIIGVRTLTFYKDFFHTVIAMIRQWGYDLPIIAGGPHATTNYANVLQDRNIDLVVMGEGEETLAHLMKHMLEYDGKIPPEEVLQEIQGIAYIPGLRNRLERTSRDVIILDGTMDSMDGQSPLSTKQEDLPQGSANDPAFVVFTSGSTGLPKGTLLRHDGVINHLMTKIRVLDAGEGDILCQNLNVSFVASIWQFIAPLVSGIKLTFFDDDLSADPYRFFQALSGRKVSIAEVVPSMLTAYLQLLDAGKPPVSLEHLKILVLTGERVSAQLVNRFYREYKIDLLNAYGQSECSDDTLHYKIPFDTQTLTVPIGKPSDNTRVYVLDTHLNPVPTGVPGQLYISGTGLATGYLNNPALTAEKFIPNPYSDGERMYQTGDLVRWLPDKNLEFLGRVDHQIKIRGFRVELGEIENRLLTHDNIKAAAAALKGNEHEPFLCAYVVPHDNETGLNLGRLKDDLAADLPGYMIPSHIIALTKLPLTASGKLDRKTLPEPSAGIIKSTESGGEEKDEIQEQLTTIWADILKADANAINGESNFFRLGGNSLRAVTLVSRLHKDMDVDISLVDIFDIHTLKELAEYVKRTAGKGGEKKYTSIPKAAPNEFYPLSPAQKRLFILQQMESQNTGYNNIQIIKLKGDIDAQTLESIFRKLIQRHESLRTSFKLVNNQPVQQIHDTLNFKLCAIGPISPIIQSKPFDLSVPPLLRAGLISLEDNSHLLKIEMHHIISDGTSMGILLNECLALAAGKDLPPLPIQYKDFASWQSGNLQLESFKKQEQYWLKEFQGEIPVLNLPLDFDRPSNLDFAGRSVPFTIGASDTQKLKQLVPSVENGKTITLYMILLSTFAAFLNLLSGQEDIVIGTPVAGRRHPDVRHLIGMFVNTLAIRTFPAGNKKFSDFLEEIRIQTISAFDQQDYPFEELVEKADVVRDTGRNPIFDVMFAMQNFEGQAGQSAKDEPPSDKGIQFMPYEIDTGTSKFDLSLSAVEDGDKLSLSFEYRTSLFKEETIHRYITYFKNAVHQLAEQPGTSLMDIDILPPEERRLLIEEFNNTQSSFPEDKTIHQWFEEQVEKKPNREAITENRTYKQLNEDSNRLAHRLKKHGVSTGSIVAILTDRSPAMVTGIFAILKAGGAYLPIDPLYPADRIKYILEDSETSLLLSGAGELEPGETPDHLQVLSLELSETGSQTVENTDSQASPEDLAYLMYTSGSTGNPKGVLVQHNSVVNILYALYRHYPLNDGDTYLFKTSYVFDVSVSELFGWYPGGGQLAILEKNGEKDARGIIDAIEYHNITHINFVPSMFSAFLDVLNKDNIHKLSSLKYIFLAGEALPAELVNRFNGWNDKLDVKLENIYGPTEATIYASAFSLSQWDGSASVPIGKPLPNIQLHILNSAGKIQPLGVNGELCIGGTGLGRGYWKQPSLTEDKFPLLDGLAQTPVRLYKTGDLARRMPDGNILYLGRMDQQVKVRGFRIETGEIEHFLRQHPEIDEAVVLAKTPGHKNDLEKYLCAFYVSTRQFSAADLREFLSRELPGYMLPSYFLQLEKLPRNTSGKIDKKKLSGVELEQHRSASKDYAEPRNSTEEQIVAIWKETLALESIGIHDNFFHIGGDSLKAIQLVSKMMREFDINMNDVFKHQTPAAMAGHIKLKKDNIRRKIENLRRKLSSPEALNTEYAESNPAYKTLLAEHREYLKEVSVTRFKGIKAGQKYRHILLTGATGFLGAHLASELLHQTNAHLYLLVRGGDESHAVERLKDTFNYYLNDSIIGADSISGHRIRVLHGDLTQPNLGLELDSYRSLCASIDAILHSAANTRHFGDYSQFYRHNVIATENLLRFAAEGKGKDVHYISTLSTGSGNIENKDHLLFSEFVHDAGQRHHNVYIRSKQEAEKCILSFRQRGGNASIYRIGNLVFHSGTGRFQKNIEANAFYANFKSFVQLGAVAESLRFSDMTFVDHTARAIVLLMMKKNLTGKTFHLQNNHLFAWKDMDLFLEHSGIKIQVLKPQLFLDYLVEKMDDPQYRKNVERFFLHFGLFENEQSNQTTHLTVSGWTQKLLEQLKFSWPQVAEHHIDKMVSHCRKVGFLE